MDQIEKLFKLLMIGGILLTLCRVLIFYIKLKLQANKPKRKPLDAADVIRCGGMHPANYKEIVKDVIVDHTRTDEIEAEYLELKTIFTNKVKNKQITRGQILGIKEYLYKNITPTSSKKKFNNDIHEIYSLLKASDLSTKHIATIESFLR